MTGIDRLRSIAGAWDEWGLGGALAEMADQIERELREERDRWDSELCEAQMDKSRVTAVYLEMNKHVLGHEGMEDSPVARWARELREALDGKEHDRAEDVSMSAYDLLPADERDAIAWVREHGGLDHVREEWRSRVTHEPRDSWERINEDVMVDAKDYCESRGIGSEYPKHSGKAKCEDIVRRCRALAERERGE